MGDIFHVPDPPAGLGARLAVLHEANEQMMNVVEPAALGAAIVMMPRVQGTIVLEVLAAASYVANESAEHDGLRTLVRQLAEILNVSRHPADGTVGHGSVDGMMLIMPEEIDAELLMSVIE